MSKTLLAMVAAKGSHTGPWMRSKGIERQVIVESLGDREAIVLEYEANRVQNTVAFYANGSYPFPECLRFRAVKLGNDQTDSPATNVKIDIGD